MNNKGFKDTLKLAKEFKCNEFVFNFTSLDDYYRSPLIPDNQKVLIALLELKKRFKSLTLYNSSIANYLNQKGIYAPIYKEVETYDENGELKKEPVQVGEKIIHSKLVIKDGIEVEQPLYTKTAVSDAIKKWEKEGVLVCNYEYSFNKDKDKPYKFITKRTISINFDNLKPILSCCMLDSVYYKNLPERSRKRKLIRQRPFSILDDLKELFNDLAEELKIKYQTAKGIFNAFCWNTSRRFYKLKLTNKPTATENIYERNKRLENRALNQLLEPDRYNIQNDSKGTPNQTIKAVFDKMVGTY